MYSTAEAAEKTGLCESWVRRLCQLERIGTRVGGRWVLTDKDIAYLEQERTPGRPAVSEKSNG